MDSWRDKAECDGMPYEIFFPQPAITPQAQRRHEEAAISICNDCEVRHMCLDHALTTNQRYGIWGGKTEEERRLLRRKRRRGER